MVFSNNLLLGAVSEAAGDYLIEQSLLFDDTAYLNRTPSTAGNRKTWTYSVWFKLGNTATQQLFTAGDDNNNCSRIQYQSTNTILFRHLDGGSVIDDVVTNAVFRDSSAWYHIVVSVDTTQSTDTNRVKIYINGTAQSFGTTNYPTLNFDTDFNSTVKHTIGDLPADADHEFNGLMALPILVDGSALAPTDFGETDANGFWNPIEFVPDTVGSNLTANYVTSVSNDGGGGFATSPVTFSSVDIGTASATRKVIVGVGIDGYQGNEAYTSLTIGGVAANLIQEQNAASGGRPVALYELDVASGTSADIVVTFTGTQTKCYSMGIGVWTIEGGTLFSTVGSTANPGAGNISVSSGGTVIAIMTEGNASATYTWANLTENFDNQVRASRQAFSGASKNLSSATTQAISATSSGGTQFAMLAASFAPAGGYGTNGFQLDFADTADFGKNVSGATGLTPDLTESSSWSGTFLNEYTFTGTNIDKNTLGQDAIRTKGVWEGDFSIELDLIDTTGFDGNEQFFGIASAADTFDDTITAASISGTNYYVYAAGLGSSTLALRKNGASATTVSVTSGDTVKWERSGTTITFYVNDVSAYSETTTLTGLVYGFLQLYNTNESADNIGTTGTYSNSFVSNNFVAADQLEDTPTDSADDGIGNFATLNPLNNTRDGGATLSNGNLNYSATAGNSEVPGTIVIPEDTTDTWVIEFTNVSLGSNRPAVGLIQNSIIGVAGVTGGASEVAYNNGGITIDTVGQGSITTDATIRFEYNGTDNEVEVFTAGVSRGTYSWTPAGPFTFYAARAAGTATCSINTNISLMEGTVTAGAKSFGTQNLPAPTIADGSQYFNTVLYTGDDGTSNAITGVNFQPDFVWIKNRTGANNHTLVDSIRGGSLYLESNNTAAEQSAAVVASFDSDGFTIGTSSIQVNSSSHSYVAWCWKAGGAASSNTDGTITSSVSANTTSGFSIVSYTGNATAGATFGHGLSSAPKFILAKNRDDGVNAWAGYHVALGGTHRIFLNTNAAAQDDDGNWNDTDPSATVVTLGNGGISNKTGDNFIAYCWAEVEGFSKFGSYTGNANVDGPFIYTGFKPAFILEKRTDSAGAWYITDMTRDTYNPVNKYLMPDASNAEASGSTSSGVYLDALSNGYKIRGAGAGQEYNRSGGTYIFAAFAEHPFQGADGVTQARAR